jgi:hypothetical protein
MTPKEKAEELIDKIYYCQRYADGENYIPLEAYKRAKQCALIALDEILNNIMFFWYSPTKDMPKDIAYFVTQKKYWEQVKEEIEKL